MELHIWGGAGEHGRSCYFLKIGGKRLLFDCGVKKGAQAPYPLLDEEEVRLLDAVFLTHSHEDHSVAIPLLYKLGYRGVVHATLPTIEQYEDYIRAWTSTTRARGEQLPYGEEDIRRVRFAMLPASSGMLVLDDGIRILWGRSGHLLGAVWFMAMGPEGAFFYSGDYTTESALLAADSPRAVLEQNGVRNAAIDLAVIDSAYGTDERGQQDCVEELLSFCKQVQRQGGKLLMPLPAYGRGQELLCLLKQADLQMPILVEQSIYDPIRHFLAHPEFLAEGGAQELKDVMLAERVQVITHERQREQWLKHADPALILTTDGMLTSELAQWYADKLQNDKRNAILFTGHLAPGTPGNEIADRKRRSPGKMAEHRLQVAQIAYKVHQGYHEVARMLDEIRPEQAVLCHASPSRTIRLAERLSLRYTGVLAVHPGQSVKVPRPEQPDGKLR